MKNVQQDGLPFFSHPQSEIRKIPINNVSDDLVWEIKTSRWEKISGDRGNILWYTDFIHQFVCFIRDILTKLIEMAFQFEDLNARTRELMLQEIDADIESGRLYPSKRFTDLGHEKYPELLRDAVAKGDESTLTKQLTYPEYFLSHETTSRNGKKIVAKVPSNAPSLIAEGEFNRFYMRALCRRAMDEGVKLQVYRARASAVHREISDELVARYISPDELLNDLRKNVGLATFLNVPPGPNSGMSIRLINN